MVSNSFFEILIFFSLSLFSGLSSFSGGQLLVSLGSLLDDFHWHTVKLERLNTLLNLTVDKNTHQVQVPDELTEWDIRQVRSFHVPQWCTFRYLFI